MKTLQEIKEEVAAEIGYKDWSEFTLDFGEPDSEIERQMGDVAKRYAEEAIDQCAVDLGYFDIDKEITLSVKDKLI